MSDSSRSADPSKAVFKRARLPLLLAAVTLVGGCSLLKDRSADYATAVDSKPLHGIDGEPLPRQAEAYPIRAISAVDSGQPNQVPQPPDMTAEILDENYVIETLDDQSWLLVNEVPGRIWPAVSAWMAESGLAIAEDSTQLGLLQSELVNYGRRARSLVGLEQAAENEPKMLVQVRLSPGVRRKTTEIQVRPRSVAQAPDGLLPWSDEPSEQAKERELLANLSGFLQAREDSRSYSRAALAMDSEPRVAMGSYGADQQPAILIELPYTRAWGEIRRVLEDEGIPVVDLDQSAGYLLVDGRPADDRQRSWLTRWFAGDEVEPVATSRIQLQNNGDGVAVTAMRVDGYDGGNYSQSLLSRLYDYLY